MLLYLRSPEPGQNIRLEHNILFSKTPYIFQEPFDEKKINDEHSRRPFALEKL